MAFIGTVVPAYGMVIVYNQSLLSLESRKRLNVSKKQQEKDQAGGGFTSWAIVALFTLVLVGFSTGLFGVHPSLIGSGSMSPNILVGDIVIAREAPIETIMVGDVIAFYQEGVTIVHRVIEIDNHAGQIIFITKGDANNSADPPVLAGNYQGKVVLTIPKIGWISIYVRNFMVKLL